MAGGQAERRKTSYEQQRPIAERLQEAREGLERAKYNAVHFPRPEDFSFASVVKEMDLDLANAYQFKIDCLENRNIEPEDYRPLEYRRIDYRRSRNVHPDSVITYFGHHKDDIILPSYYLNERSGEVSQNYAHKPDNERLVVVWRKRRLPDYVKPPATFQHRLL